MRKFLRFEDDSVVELSPITYREFLAIDQWSGSSDMAYEDWMRHNGYEDADNYCDDTLANASFSVSLEPIPPERFEFSVDKETWKPLDLKQEYAGRCLDLKKEV